jgi:hypothetical protein
MDLARCRVLVLRYRALVDHPHETIANVLDFLGMSQGKPAIVPHDNTRPFRPDTLRTRTVARLVRAGAAAGAYLPPEVWRSASRPLLRELHRQGAYRPDLTPEQRRLVLEPLLHDLELLERVTGQSFQDWRADVGRGSFGTRVKEPQTTSSDTRS